MSENEASDHAVPADVREGVPPAICYATWQARIQMASDIDRLSQVVREYFSGWQYHELRLLPHDLSVIALAGSGDLAASAVLATQAELKFDGDPHAHQLLREAALTLRAAASRFRFLTSLRTREREGSDSERRPAEVGVTEEEVRAYRREYPRLSRTEILWTIARHGPARSEVERALADIAWRKR